MQKEKAEYVGEGIDRLVTLDLRARVIYRLCDATRKLTEAPLTLTAARRIMEAVKPGDMVLITTGFIVRLLRLQGADGPLLLIEEQSKDILPNPPLHRNDYSSRQEGRCSQK